MPYFLTQSSTAALALAVVMSFPPPATAAPGLAVQTTATVPEGTLRVEELSPAFLGMYRKVMEIEDEIRRYADAYGVDFDLARAVCLYESGGNANLNSHAGAQGYFQVMPPTFRLMRVETNIEAGIKYLSQMVKQFKREDYALVAYNGGPGRVTRGRPPLESLQYVLGVGAYRSVLKLFDASLRHHAQQLSLETVREDDDWLSLSRRTGASVLQLRLHNPFLAGRSLRAGQQVAFPSTPRTDLFTRVGDDLEYRTRHGDNYFNLAFVLDVEVDTLRDSNSLWRLQTLPAGQVLRIPLKRDGKYNEHRVQAGEDLRAVAERVKADPWRIIRDNQLFWDEPLSAGMLLKVQPEPARPAYVTHRVSSGETLGRIAEVYGTTIRAIQAANNLGRSTLIRIGQLLRVPTRNG